MNKFRTRLAARQRRAKVAVLVAVMLPTVLIPLLAIAVDGGMLMRDKRKVQSAVDAAALSAAAQLYRDNRNHNLSTVQPPQTEGANDAALDALDGHGFPDASCQLRDINIPAASTNSSIDGKPGTVEVVASYLQPRGFSLLWASGGLPVTARGVARVRNFSQGAGILLLEESEDRALYARGEGQLVARECGVVVNSSGPAAAETNGSNAVLAATSFEVTGGYIGTGFYKTPYPSAGTAQPYTGCVPVPDPLRDLPEPDRRDYTVQTAPPNAGPSGSTITLEPGRYTTRLFYDGPRTVELLPGLYYLDAGIGLQGQVKMVGAEVMIYNAGSGANNINLGGSGQWSLSPPASGTYAGISLFQSRNTASPNTTNVLRGNGSSSVTGTIYMPTTKVHLTGNGSQTLGSQFIARTLEMSGQGTFTVDFTAQKAPQPAVIELVE